MNAIYGCSTDMGGVLSRGQGEAAAATVVATAASYWPDESACWCRACRWRRVVKSEMRGLVTAGPWVRVGVDRLSRIEREHVAGQRVCS